MEAVRIGASLELRDPTGKPGGVPVRAGLIRAIARGLAVPHDEIDPHGLSLQGALFAERLDLDNIAFDRPLRFGSCTFAEGVTAQSATLHTLHLEDCNVSAPEGSVAIRLTHARFSFDLSLKGNRVVGEIRMLGASISGLLGFRGGTHVNPTGPAVFADKLTSVGKVILSGDFWGKGHFGAVRLAGASLGGQLTCRGGTFTNTAGPALDAQGLSTDGNVYLAGEFAGDGEMGTICLIGARIGGQLDFEGGVVVNQTGPALVADTLESRGNVCLAGKLTGEGPLGAVRLVGARIGDQLDCREGTFSNTLGPALFADGLRAEDEVFLGGSFVGAGEGGAVRLPGARIGGNLFCHGGNLANPTGPAFYADGISVDGNAVLDGTFIGAGDKGAVRLPKATIAGQLSCTGGRFSNAIGLALLGDGATIGSHVYLNGEFEGRGAWGVVHLAGVTIGGQLFCTTPGWIKSTDEGALDLRGTQVKLEWALDPGFRDADTPRRWLNIDGLTYQGFPQPNSSREWPAALAQQTIRYAAQPWQHLADAHRASGHDHEARATLVAQQEDRRLRVIQPASRIRSWALCALNAMTGYGYMAHRALIWLGVWAVVGAFVALGAGSMGLQSSPGQSAPVAVLAHVAQTPGGLPTPCSVVDVIGLGLEWSVPLFATHASDTCVLDSMSPAGQGFTIASWVLRLVGWALATFAVAGYTGLVRRV